MADQRRVPVGDVALEVLEAGAGGRPFLLVHGFTGAKEDFAGHLDALGAAGWHVVAPDQRGHGVSDQPADEAAYSLAAYAGDALGLADALGWDRFVLLGHSMGGMVAQVVALQAPERVEALVLMDTGHGRVPLEREMVERAAALCREVGMATFADILDRAGPSPLETEAARALKEARPELVEANARKIRACSPAMYSAMALAMLDADDRLAALAAITAPTLVLVGELDGPFVKPSRRMAEAIPGARLEVIPDAGHSPQDENPEAWAKALGAFLASLP